MTMLVELTVLIATLAGLLMGGCAEKTPPATSGGGAVAGVAPIVSGMALPPGYKIDTGRTLVLGADDRWTGRVSYTSSTSADDVFDFLRREMPNFGWTETAAMRSDVSLLTFASDGTDRVAMIEIARGSMFGSTRVEIVVSPRVIPSSAKSATPVTHQPLH